MNLIACKGAKPAIKSDELQITMDYSYEYTTVSITNSANFDVRLPNYKMFSLRQIDGDEKRIPIYPCKCGVPCTQPSVPKTLLPGETLTFKWDNRSRKCTGLQEESFLIGEGTYEIGINYQLVENDVIKKVDTHYLVFEVDQEKP